MESLRNEWDELWPRCSGATVFQSPAWLIPWWKHLGEGELWVAALRQEDRLVGVAPLFIYDKPGAGQREVLFLGTGISDYLDLLLEDDYRRPAAVALFEYLAAHRDRWDVCDFQQLRANSPLLAMSIASSVRRPLFQAPEREGPFEHAQGWTPSGDWASELTVQEVCPVLGLPGVVESLHCHTPARMLQKLGYYRRRLERLAGQIEEAGPGNFSELFERFLELHQRRWTARGQSGVLAEARLQAFHRDAARGLLQNGLLRLYGLRVDGKIVGSLYGFSDSRRSCFYLSGFDPDYASLSPGTLLIGHAIEAAVREGLREFDFLRGREAYKYLWGAKGQVNYRRRLWPAGQAS